MDLLGPALYLASEQHQTIWFQVFPNAKLFAHLSLWWGGHVCAYPQLHLKRLDWPRALCTSHLIIALNIIPTQDIAGYHTHVSGRGGSKADLTYRTIWRITQRCLIAPQHNEWEPPHPKDTPGQLTLSPSGLYRRLPSCKMWCTKIQSLWCFWTAN